MLAHLQISYVLSLTSEKNHVNFRKDIIKFEEAKLLDGKLAAAARGSKSLKKEGSCSSITCNIGPTK